MSKSPLIDTESADDAIYEALRLHINVDWSPDDLAEVLNKRGYKVAGETVNRWVAGSKENRRTPKADGLLILCQLLGKKFTSKVLSRIGMGAYERTPTSAAPAAVVATMAYTTHRFAEAGVDQKFCNVELGELEPVADAAIAVLEPFSSKRGG